MGKRIFIIIQFVGFKYPDKQAGKPSEFLRWIVATACLENGSVSLATVHEVNVKNMVKTTVNRDDRRMYSLEPSP